MAISASSASMAECRATRVPGRSSHAGAPPARVAGAQVPQNGAQISDALIGLQAVDRAVRRVSACRRASSCSVLSRLVPPRSGARSSALGCRRALPPRRSVVVASARRGSLQRLAPFQRRRSASVRSKAAFCLAKASLYRWASSKLLMLARDDSRSFCSRRVCSRSSRWLFFAIAERRATPPADFSAMR